MPKFEQIDSQNAGDKWTEENKRLYGNDLSANKFATKAFEPAEEIPENRGQFGTADDKSAEESIYEKATPEYDMVIAKASNDYLNGLAEMPKDMNIDQVRAAALTYRESLSAEDQKVEDTKAARLLREEIKAEGEVKYTEPADLKHNLMAQATPNPLETTKLNRRSLWDYISGRKKRA